MTTQENRTIVINENVFKELEYMVNLHKEKALLHKPSIEGLFSNIISK
jgi:predicted nucleic acid-binding protein